MVIVRSHAIGENFQMFVESFEFIQTMVYEILDVRNVNIMVFHK